MHWYEDNLTEIVTLEMGEQVEVLRISGYLMIWSNYLNIIFTVLLRIYPPKIKINGGGGNYEKIEINKNSSKIIFEMGEQVEPLSLKALRISGYLMIRSSYLLNILFTVLSRLDS